MRSISKSIKQLAKLTRNLAPVEGPRQNARLVRIDRFGSNPGELNGWSYVPENLLANAPLVVVLHGCTQSAASYDHGAQWSQLANHHGFALLFPEQTRSNNMNLCFNWFEPGDSRRDAGEPASIAQMVQWMVKHHGLDHARVFITGLSAGGAMTSTMLATYPDLFAAGAIIAGLPFGSAVGIPQALERMGGRNGPKGKDLARQILAQPFQPRKWPAISVWHGSADYTVAPSNAADIVDQWRGVHRLPEQPDVDDLVAGQRHRAWRGADGRFVIEEFIIAGMGHGTPLDSRQKVGGGKASPHMLDVGLSSTRHLAQMWEIMQPPGDVVPEVTRSEALPIRQVHATRPVRETTTQPPSHDPIKEIIEKALRTAGLMK